MASTRASTRSPSRPPDGLASDDEPTFTTSRFASATAGRVTTRPRPHTDYGGGRGVRGGQPPPHAPDPPGPPPRPRPPPAAAVGAAAGPPPTRPSPSPPPPPPS